MATSLYRGDRWWDFQNTCASILQIALIVGLVVLLWALYSVSPYRIWQVPVIHFANTALTLAFGLDHLARIMMVVVLTITLIIFRYSRCYLDSDNTRLRFLIQLCLVSGSVMMLVLSANLFTAFIGWQLIGLNLYILLNHYHYDLQANRAAKKKFIINRIGDLCFLAAVILCYQQFGTSAYSVLFASSHTLWIGTLITIAVMTKSAQFPFHIWLPDTMETPTPVSALMHAGVINAGGFLIARTANMYVSHPALLWFIFVIGLITALLGTAWMNYQPDTKKQLAYSTMGQMGYMIMQCGLGAFSAAIFHLIAHGFYKGYLFLSAGNTLAHRSQSRPSRSILSIAMTLFAAILTYFLLEILGRKLQIQLPVLLQCFILLTAMQLTYQLFQYGRFSGCVIGTITMLIMVTIYVFLLAKLTLWLGIIDGITAINISVQWVIGLALIIIQITWWLLPTSARQLQHWPTPWTRWMLRKGGIEYYCRHWLLHPLRLCGEWTGPKLNRWILPLLFITFGAIILGIANWYGRIATPGTIDIIFLGMIILAAVVANRAKTLRDIFCWLIILEASFVCLGLFDHSHAIKVIGIFHLINMAGVMLMLGIVKFRQARAQQLVFISIFSNKLPWLMFYLSSALLLLIGIPGTASFVSEFFIFSALLQSAPVLAAIYAIGMLLLAITVLHALQTYVFDSQVVQKGALLSVTNHLICWAVIVINVLNGVWPQWLLHKITILGGVS